MQTVKSADDEARTLSTPIALAEERERGSAITLDEDFTANCRTHRRGKRFEQVHCLNDQGCLPPHKLLAHIHLYSKLLLHNGAIERSFGLTLTRPRPVRWPTSSRESTTGAFSRGQWRSSMCLGYPRLGDRLPVKTDRYSRTAQNVLNPRRAAGNR
jgi:hypothetical protein